MDKHYFVWEQRFEYHEMFSGDDFKLKEIEKSILLALYIVIVVIDREREKKGTTKRGIHTLSLSLGLPNVWNPWICM